MSDTRVMTLQGFLQRFLAQHAQRTDHPFCFILGAGASKPSGIPTGGELARQWLQEMCREENFKSLEFEQWAAAENLGIDGFTLEKCADFYPEIYERRFKDHPDEGYAFLESEMDKKEPSFGYAVLAYLMSETDHRIVITTNFDNLMGDALSIHSTKFPLIIGHDALAGFAGVDPRRPLVAKIHGAVGFSPKNTQGEIRCLPDVWQKPIEGILHRCSLLVIGYSGNDGSLMGFLEKLPSGVPDNVFWFILTDEEDPDIVWKSTSQRIRNFISDKNGYLVPIPGFDELMLVLSDHIREPLKMPDLYTRLQERNHKRENSFDEQIKRLREELGQKKKPLVEAKYVTTTTMAPENKMSSEKVIPLVQDAAGRLAKSRPEKPWWEWVAEANQEADTHEKYAIYEKALIALPNSSPLLIKFANYLNDECKNIDLAEEYFNKAIDADPKNSVSIVNYARFLSKTRNDNENAEKYYLRSLETDPKDAYINNQYALFLSDILKDYDRAEKYFLQATEADPKYTYANICFALFLSNIRKDYDGAEKYFLQAIEADPKYAFAINRYAHFLSEIRKDYDSAEKYYLQAIEADPKDAYYNNCYALFLSEIRKDYDGAEKYFLQAIEADPKYAFAINRYAHFLSEIRKDYDSAEKYYLQAIEADPKDAYYINCYADFLSDIRNNQNLAEEYYREAKKANN